MKRMSFMLITCSLLSFSACTEPGETTAIGAATGGVMGAGLGAIIGSQTGSAGGGLAIGAAAGAATGAAVGNALEAQQQAVRTQDEALERQEKMIAAQKAEIDELRVLNQDGSSVRNGSVNGTQASGSRVAADTRAALRREPYQSNSRSAYGKSGRESFTSPRSGSSIPLASGAKTKTQTSGAVGASGGSSIKSRTLVEESTTGAIVEDISDSAGVIEQDPSAKNAHGSINPAFLDSDECQKASDEARAGDAAGEASEQLFHYRRALRMCPNNPDFHNRLGEVYVRLNRPADARFEFEEALKHDSTHSAARANLKGL